MKGDFGAQKVLPEGRPGFYEWATTAGAVLPRMKGNNVTDADRDRRRAANRRARASRKANR